MLRQYKNVPQASTQWYDNEWGYANRIADLIRISRRVCPSSRFDWAAFEALA